ncbi:MAG: cupin domain-containing protein, partial [Candidatus Methanomethylophilus sp.]|nr:cupin domain-containing protein [Methanomethylophilus sp.]MBQ5447792.1 cupin domain-containing protein [Methanomethylophilus sp.]
MRMDFGSMEEVTIPHMNGGEGSIIARMYNDDHSRIIYTRIPAGSSIGIHRQESGDDINYVLEGKGMAVCDGQEEPL